VSLDREGVGELVKIAVERGRKSRNDLKLGICGEHGGDPASIAFCDTVGLDYVSCSPFRVPIARLAAAQAAIGKTPARQAGCSTRQYSPDPYDIRSGPTRRRNEFRSTRRPSDEFGGGGPSTRVSVQGRVARPMQQRRSWGAISP